MARLAMTARATVRWRESSSRCPRDRTVERRSSLLHLRIGSQQEKQRATMKTKQEALPAGRPASVTREHGGSQWGVCRAGSDGATTLPRQSLELTSATC